MIFKSVFITFVSLFFGGLVWAQNTLSIPIYNKKVLANSTLMVYSDSGALTITALKANLIKVSFFALDKPVIESVAKNNSYLNIRITQNLDDIFFATDSLWIIVSKIDLSIRFLKKVDEQLFVKNESYFLNNKGRNISFSLKADEKPSVFDYSKLKSVGNKIESSKRLLRKKKFCNPILLSQMGYSVAVENPATKKIIVRPVTKNIIQFSAGSDETKSFYFLSGDKEEMRENLKNLRSHTR